MHDFKAISEESMSYFFQDKNSFSSQHIGWMLLALCKNQTAFHQKLCRELSHCLTTQTPQGRQINQQNILALAEFLEKI